MNAECKTCPYVSALEDIRKLWIGVVKNSSMDNAKELAKIPGMNNEARAREMAVLYIDELFHNVWFSKFAADLARKMDEREKEYKRIIDFLEVQETK